MSTDHRTLLRARAICRAVERAKSIRWFTLVFTLMVAIACSGGSSGSSGKKKKDTIRIRRFPMVADTTEQAAPLLDPAERDSGTGAASRETSRRRRPK